MDITQLIDHTLLKTETTASDIERLCAEAKTHRFWAVCVNPCWVARAARLLSGSDVKICSVAGFPLGATRPEIRAREAALAIEDGASEIDTVLNVGALKDGDLNTVEADLRKFADACRAGSALSKVILETHLLSDKEKETACTLAAECGIDFVKTSTGLFGGGATVADIVLMSRVVKPHGLGVKASGGIRTLADLRKMVEAGATRIGTSSGVAIAREAASGA